MATPPACQFRENRRLYDSESSDLRISLFKVLKMPANRSAPYEKSGVVSSPPYFDPSDYFSCMST